MKFGKDDAIRCLLVLSRAVPLDLVEGQFSHIETGDLLLAAALHGDDEIRSRCVAALKALPSIGPKMSPSSANAIRDNLQRLGVSMSDAEFSKMRSSAISPQRDLAAARRRIASFFI